MQQLRFHGKKGCTLLHGLRQPHDISRYRPGSRPEVEEACRGRRIVTSSDAHYLWDIAEGDPARRSPDSRPCLFEPDGDPLSRLILSALPR